MPIRLRVTTSGGTAADRRWVAAITTETFIRDLGGSTSYTVTAATPSGAEVECSICCVLEKGRKK